MPPYSLAQIAQLLGAQLFGDGHCVIRRVSTVANARAGDIVAIYDPRYVKALANTQASAVVLPPRYVATYSGNYLVMDNPRWGHKQLADLFQSTELRSSGIHPRAVIDSSCQVGSDVTIGANAVIEQGVTIGTGSRIDPGCVIGANTQLGAYCVLHANVTLSHGITLGNRVILHSGVVIGSDGFSVMEHEGVWHRIAQLGSVVIGDDVEIGANTSIDRGSIHDTIIEQGVKIDNLVQIGHNVCIGAHTVIAGCTGIAGSVTIGKHCIIGGSVSIRDHIEIADHVVLAGCAMVTESLQQPGAYASGTGIIPLKSWHRIRIWLMQLENLARRIKRLEKKS